MINCYKVKISYNINLKLNCYGINKLDIFLAITIIASYFFVVPIIYILQFHIKYTRTEIYLTLNNTIFLNLR